MLSARWEAMIFQAHFLRKSFIIFSQVVQVKNNPEKENHLYWIISYVRYSVFYWVFFNSFFVIYISIIRQAHIEYPLHVPFWTMRKGIIKHNPWPCEVFHLVGKIRIRPKTQLEKNTTIDAVSPLLCPTIPTPIIFLPPLLIINSSPGQNVSILNNGKGCRTLEWKNVSKNQLNCKNPYRKSSVLPAKFWKYEYKLGSNI